MTDSAAYRVLARKYRPQNFAELIGQEALVRTLQNAISTGRIAHAYMLTGVRGVGKTTTARTYDETVRGYLERQREYRDRYAAGLKDVQIEQAEKELDDFFENEVRAGADRLNQLCELLLERLKGGATLEVILKGFTSPRAESDYNLNLAKRRISSVRNHFELFSDGALQPYLQTGKLKVSELSFGETVAKGGISDRLTDERNSIYHPDAARERRVEIVEVLQK